MTDLRVRDLFDIPEAVGKETFVLKLADGVQRAEETARSYVVTPTIVDAVDSALRMVRDSLADGQSRATYVHGSFGSGKSHYMAILSLLLDGNEAARRIPELHEVLEKHKGSFGKKLLQLRFHMVGESSLESAIFRTYVRWVRDNHPSARVPPLFADQDLFADAERLLERIGDDAFFGPMNPEGDGSWGELDRELAWDRARFVEASQSSDPDARGALFDALVKTHFSAFAKNTAQFINLDEGLAVMTAHARSLGFDGIVLFLDELVLWLASGAADHKWMHGETQKVSKLVEAQAMNRAIPIIGFIARQRDLADMVGDEFAGAENKRLRETLAYFHDRFGRIQLGDQNLPAIVEKRVLRPKSPDAKQALDDGFQRLQRAAKASWSTLQASEDGEAFRKLYPFSPALIETLVGLSNALQRNRTALKLLTEILVDHIGDLKLGDVVPVGDLWDLVAGGDDSTDGVMRVRFEQAKQLYRQHLLPLIHDSNGTGSAEKCQRLRPEHRVSLGCSGCPQTACRNDNRILKTLLLAALLPEVAPLRDLTVSKLVQLNHGTIRAPIPGTESALAAQRLRNWAAKAGELQVGKQADPTVSITIGLVNLANILNQAREHDNPGSRLTVIRDVLFKALELSPDPRDPLGADETVEWRGSKRIGHVRFGNVRRLPVDVLRCPEHHDWRLIIDYPFDDPGFGPNDDLEVVDKIREEGSGTWTLVWLPSFFSEATNTLVGEIAILDHILSTKESVREYTRHLRVEEQLSTEQALRSLRDQKRMRLEGAITQAYGLARETEHDIDPTRGLQQHLHLLKPGMKIVPAIGGNLTVALEDYVPKVLEKRYPHHPAFPRVPTKAMSERAVELFGRLIELDDRRLQPEREDLEKLRATLEPLGLVRVIENAVNLVEDRLLEIDRKRQQRGVDHPSVDEVRAWFDENHLMGLHKQTADLVVRSYTRWAARTMVRYGQPYVAPFGAEIPGDVQLEKPTLPSPAEWGKALETAGVFGVTLPGRALHADNVKKFEAEVTGRVKALAASVVRLPALLANRLRELEMSDDVDRMKTARSSDGLIASLQNKSGVELVRVLAAYVPVTSTTAVQRSLGSAAENVRVLEERLVFGTFQQLRSMPEGATILADVQRALRSDETVEALAPRLRRLAEVAQETLLHREPVPPIAPPVTPPQPQPPVPVASPVPAASGTIRVQTSRQAFSDAIAQAARDAQAAIATAGEDAVIEIEIRVRKGRA